MKASPRLPVIALALSVEVSALSVSSLPAEARSSDPIAAVPASRLNLNTSGLHPSGLNSSSFDRGNWLEARVSYRRSRRRYPFPRWGTPSWSTGGAARGGCNTGEAPLVPLMPVNTETGNASFFGVTLLERPTFFAYVPQTVAQEVEFLLVDEEAGQVVYEKRLPVIRTPQIISIKLDNSVPPLTIGRNYKWSFATICNPKDPAVDVSGNPYIPGLIQRIEPSSDLMRQLSGASLSERVALFAQEGAWLDSFTALSQLRCQKPNDRTVATDWQTLLNAVELNRIPGLSNLVQREPIDRAPLNQCTITQ